jgi:aminoacrylate hydrolase
MPRFDASGASVAYEVAGDGEALVLIAGLGGRGEFWQAQVAPFACRFRTITFDHRGIGGSTGAPPYAAEQWAQDVIALLDHLGIERAHLVGHSTGGVIAQVMASAYPERVASAVLAATWATPDERFRAVFELRREVLTKLGPEAYSQLASLLISPADAALAARQPDPTDPAIVKARIDVLLAYEGQGRLQSIRAPALVLAAADDFLIPPHMSRLVAERIAGAEFKVLPGGGHAFPRTMAEAYNNIVLRFLRGVARPRPAARRAAAASARPRRSGAQR